MRIDPRAVALSMMSLLCVGACSGDAPTAETSWIMPQDMASWPDALSGEDTSMDQSSGEDINVDPNCQPPDICADTSDTDTDLLCTPKERSCDGADVIECGMNGLTWEYVGDCDDGDSCTEDQCVAGECLNEALGSCCEPPCPLGQLCFNGECICAPQCFGKDCGDDGCGESCGECPGQHHCTPAGFCVCYPDCEDKLCGPDGCGESCGICPGPQDLCLGGLCICQPECDGKQCGSDGCSADCGSCPIQHDCTPDGDCVCVPDCVAKACGEDGCGGLCGQCEGPLYVCGDTGNCVQDPSFAPVLGVCTPHLHAQAVYYICWEPLKWDDAKDYCANNSTWLVTITSQAEQDFLSGLAGAAEQSLWIGLDQGFWEWDSFVWVTGEGKPVEYWSDGEPNDGGIFESEDCAEMYPSGAWNDEKCSTKQWFFCEYSS